MTNILNFINVTLFKYIKVFAIYMSESDFDGIFETFVAIFVGIGVAAGLIIGIPCGLAICLTSYCIYKGCMDSNKNEQSTSDNVNNDVEINIELENKVSIDKLDLNEVTIIGSEVLEDDCV